MQVLAPPLKLAATMSYCVTAAGGYVVLLGSEIHVAVAISIQFSYIPHTLHPAPWCRFGDAVTILEHIHQLSLYQVCNYNAHT